MKRIVFTLVLACAALCSPAQLLYRISGNGLPSPSYIIGTYHLADVGFVDSIPGIRQAMNDCQQVYGELVMSDMLGGDSVALMQQAMMLPEGMTLQKLLTADEMSRLNAFMKELMGMDMNNPMVAQQMGKMTPSALSTLLSVYTFVKKGGNFNVQNSFDDYFQKQARNHGKTVGGLETLAFQIKVLYGGKSLERQKELLMCQVDNAAFMDEMTDRVIKAFYAQDLDALMKALDEKLNNSCDTSPEEEAELIYNRNSDWVTKMPALMIKKPTLFAVGAAHLPGEKGVLNLLRQAGYKVEGIK